MLIVCTKKYHRLFQARVCPLFSLARFQMNPEEVLDNIICARAHNSEQQYELLSDAAALMSDSR